MCWLFLLLLPAAVMLWLLYEVLEHTWIQYNTTKVECHSLLKNEELRICVISDLHNNYKNTEKLTRRIREFHPEVILLAGDIVDKHKIVQIHAEAFLKALSRLDIPVFYSAGNHELSLMEKHPKEWQEYVCRLPKGITYLENRSVLPEHNTEVCISGLSLPRIFYKKGKLHSDMQDLPELMLPQHKYHILLAHHPEYAEHYKKYAPNLIVSGHLHGGLLRLPFIGGIVSPRLRLPECDAGLFKLKNGSDLFVSRGLGSHTIPLRFFNRVEVNFLVLKGTNE